MANFHITTTTPLVLTGGGTFRLTNNAALTGTITVADGTGTLAVITNPAVSNTFTYYSPNGSLTFTASGTCDLTVSQNINSIR